MVKRTTFTTNLESSETPESPVTPETPESPVTETPVPQIPETPESPVTETPLSKGEREIIDHNNALRSVGVPFCDVCGERITVGLNNTPQCSAPTSIDGDRPDCPQLILKKETIHQNSLQKLKDDEIEFRSSIIQHNLLILEMTTKIDTIKGEVQNLEEKLEQTLKALKDLEPKI